MNIQYNIGGLIATAWPAEYPTMQISWDLLGSEVFFTHNGRTIAHDVRKLTKFKQVVEDLFADVLQ